MIKNYRIFGKLIQIVLQDEENKSQIEVVSEQFGLYQELTDVENPDLIIHITKGDLGSDIHAINPKIHMEIKEGFRTIAPKIKVEFQKGQSLVARIALEKQKKGLIRYLKKLYNNQYSSIDERLAQIIYELVLVPSVYFDMDKFLVHSSAFVKDQRGAVLIGGTGGVGKTSLELELCGNRGYSFIADDISVVSDDASVWPNLSFPKIYAYNLKDNERLEKQIFKNRPLHDKWAWKFKHFLNGPAGVRRTISPMEAYGKYANEKTKVSKYYVLVKSDVEDIRVESIKAQKASEMTLAIMKTEYSAFNNHILWHEFNNKALQSEAILKLDDVFIRWKEMSEAVFSKVDCYIIHIPLQIDHQEFTKKVADIIDRNE